MTGVIVFVNGSVMRTLNQNVIEPKASEQTPQCIYLLYNDYDTDRVG